MVSDTRMPQIKIASLSQLTPGTVTQAEANGRQFAVCNVDGKPYVLDGTCPHAGGPLGHGALHGHSVVCPWHAWEFDCRTGENDYDAAIRVETYAAQAEGDDIVIKID